MMLEISELQVGDAVELFVGPWGTGLVYQVTDEIVNIFRPYGTTSGFTYGNNQAITLTGQEIVSYQRTDKRAKMKVWHRQEHR